MTAVEGAELGQSATAATADPTATAGPATPPTTATVASATAPGGNAPTPARVPESRLPVSRRQIVRAVGLGVMLLGMFLLGFAGYLYGLSGVQEARSQTVLYKQLQNELANGVAPVGPTTPGTPVAILDIPAIGLHDLVVVEGTTSQNLALGPGHLRDSPLPGQAGMSVIYGKRATFGAPFSRLVELRPGDKIIAITGQGTSSYTVGALGDSHRMVEDPSPNRLILLTAGSSSVPTYYVYADADLTSAAKPSPGNLPDISTQETALSGDDLVLAMTTLLAMALALVSVGGTVAANRWSPWLAYLSAAPVALVLLWILYENLAALLPNVY